MDIKKALGTLLLPLILTSLLFPQSLSDVAKKEKERRESLKGNKAVAVSNADLARVKKKPAYVAAGPENQASSETEAAASSKTGALTGSETALSPNLPAGLKNQLAESSQTASQRMNEQIKVDLREKYSKAKEYRELLELKMASLQQQFFNMADTKAKELIQTEISETYAKLLGAQEVENKAREDLERFLGEKLKDQISPIWIK
jgi:hypothetical protein